jgi:iron(III) transport system substrate-binding protein
MSKLITLQVLAPSLVLALLVAACTPAPQPSPTKPVASQPKATAAEVKPTAQAAKPTAQAAKPVAAASPTTGPAAAAKPAASPAPAAANNPACPCLAEDSPEWKAVLEAGRKEGEVSVLGSNSLQIVVQKLTPEFESTYGIKIKFTAGTGSDAESRIKAESDAGRVVNSAVTAGDATMYSLFNGGHLDQLQGLPNGAKLHPLEFAVIELTRGMTWPIYDLVYGIYVNSQQVSVADEPKAWKDLLDPRWKGKIVMHTPTVAGGGNTVFAVLQSTPGFGDDFLKQLAAQDPLVVRSGSDVDATVARGERPTGFPGNIHGPASQPGSPLKWVIMSDGVVRTTISMGLIKNNPTPNAAKVFLNWMLSPAMQQAVANDLEDVPATVGIPHPKGFAIESLKMLGTGRMDLSKQPENLARARELFGR